jgi:formaldehyde-activating enzyme
MPVIIGHDECVLSAVAAGAEAAILASANIMPHIWLEIMEKVTKGDAKGAANLQQKAQTLARIVTRNGGAPPAKAALKMMGIKAGKSRMPLDTGGTLTVELKDEIRLELERLQLVEPLEQASLDNEVDVSKVLDDQGYPIDAEMKTASFSNNLVSVGIAVGPKQGSLGNIFVGLLTTPKIGHEALTVILEPNLPTRPSSLMLPIKQIMSMRQASLFYGPVQSGTARAFAKMIGEGKIPEDAMGNDVAILALDIDLNLRNRREITYAAEEAVLGALNKIWRD